MNYDTILLDEHIINHQHHNPDFLFYGHDNYTTLMLMSLTPKLFNTDLSLENYISKRNKTPEQKFSTIIDNDLTLNSNKIDLVIEDKITNMPYVNVENDYFEYSLIYNNVESLDVYLWDLKQTINELKIAIDGLEYNLKNENIHKNRVFESHIKNKVHSTFKIVEINNVSTDIELIITKNVKIEYLV